MYSFGGLGKQWQQILRHTFNLHNCWIKTLNASLLTGNVTKDRCNEEKQLPGY